MEVQLSEAQALTSCIHRAVDADEALCHRSVPPEILCYTGHTLPEQRRWIIPQSTVLFRRITMVILSFSFKRQSICLVGDVESLSLPSKVVLCARPVDPLRRNARFGASLFLHSLAIS